MDIMSSVTFLQPPRFLSLYRRLFKSGAGYWATTGEHSFECKMDSLTGCPDSTVLAIAEIAALAHWKAHTDGLLGLQEFEKQIITSVRVSLTPMPVWVLTMYRLWSIDTQAWAGQQAARLERRL